MAKKINNPILVEIKKEDGITDVSFHYGVGSDEYPDLKIRKGLPAGTLTVSELTVATQVMDWAINKIEAHEGI